MTCPQCNDTQKVFRPIGVGDLMGVERCECVEEPLGCGSDCGTCDQCCQDEPETCGQWPSCEGNHHSANCDATYPHPQPAPKHGPASEPVVTSVRMVATAEDVARVLHDVYEHYRHLERCHNHLAGLLRRCYRRLCAEANGQPETEAGVAEHIALLQDIKAALEGLHE